jgi:hypothetical protein
MLFNDGPGSSNGGWNPFMAEEQNTAVQVAEQVDEYNGDEYNGGFTHEALHTAHVLQDTWDRHVVDSRCCDEFPDVKAACEKAAEAMAAAYQMIGSKFNEK